MGIITGFESCNLGTITTGAAHSLRDFSIITWFSISSISVENYSLTARRNLYGAYLIGKALPVLIRCTTLSVISENTSENFSRRSYTSLCCSLVKWSDITTSFQVSSDLKKMDTASIPVLNDTIFWRFFPLLNKFTWNILNRLCQPHSHILKVSE